MVLLSESGSNTFEFLFLTSMFEILKWFDGSKPNSELIEVEKNILKFWYVCNPDDETRQDQKINEVLEDICAYSSFVCQKKNPPKTILVNRWNSNNTFTTYFLGVWSEKLISNWSLLIQLFCTELEKVYVILCSKILLYGPDDP